MFHHMVKTQYSCNIKILGSDNGRDYINFELSRFLQDHEIVLKTTCHHTPQQNGVTEKKNRRILETTCCLLWCICSQTVLACISYICSLCYELYALLGLEFLNTTSKAYSTCSSGFYTYFVISDVWLCGLCSHPKTSSQRTWSVYTSMCFFGLWKSTAGIHVFSPHHSMYVCYNGCYVFRVQMVYASSLSQSDLEGEWWLGWSTLVRLYFKERNGECNSPTAQQIARHESKEDNTVQFGKTTKQQCLVQ